MGFNNPITGQNGALILQQIKSADFDLSSKTGWAIMKDGTAYFFNVVAEGSVTANSVILEGAGEELLAYSAAPASGDLVMAIAPVAGSDSFGNVWNQGVNLINGSKILVMGLTGGNPIIFAGTGNTNITNSGALQAVEQGVGNAAYDLWQLLGPQDATQGDSVVAQLLSSSQDGSQDAILKLFYVEPNTTPHDFLDVSYRGVRILAGSIAAVEPGTGTARNTVAQAETWHTPVLGSGWSTPARFPLQYRISADGMLEIVGNATTTSATPAAAIFTLPVGWRPTLSFRVSVGAFDGTNALVMHSVNVSSTGVVQFNSPNVSASGVEISFDHRIPM